MYFNLYFIITHRFPTWHPKAVTALKMIIVMNKSQKDLGKFLSDKKKGTHYKSIHKVSQSEQVTVRMPYHVDHFLPHIMQLLAY
jgi:hypothetical protein